MANDEFLLGASKIFEIGSYLDEMLHKARVDKECTLVINVSKDDFKKVDEDLFYRQSKEGDELIPSEGEIDVKFKKVNIIIKEGE